MRHRPCRSCSPAGNRVGTGVSPVVPGPGPAAGMTHSARALAVCRSHLRGEFPFPARLPFPARREFRQDTVILDRFAKSLKSAEHSTKRGLPFALGRHSPVVLEGSRGAPSRQRRGRRSRSGTLRVCRRRWPRPLRRRGERAGGRPRSIPASTTRGGSVGFSPESADDWFVVDRVGFSKAFCWHWTTSPPSPRSLRRLARHPDRPRPAVTGPVRADAPPPIAIPMPPPSRPGRLQRHAAFLLVTLVAAVYSNALKNGFAIDDVPIIRDNPRVHGLGSPRAVAIIRRTQ
jgi:hypothetical protein